MENIKNYVGVIVTIICAVVLTLSYFCGWQDKNAVNIGAFVIMICAIVAHVLINKKD